LKRLYATFGSTAHSRDSPDLFPRLVSLVLRTLAFSSLYLPSPTRLDGMQLRHCCRILCASHTFALRRVTPDLSSSNFTGTAKASEFHKFRVLPPNYPGSSFPPSFSPLLSCLFIGTGCPSNASLFHSNFTMLGFSTSSFLASTAIFLALSSGMVD
jgi:hypothetical protein